jgi:hypothetical protein
MKRDDFLLDDEFFNDIRDNRHRFDQNINVEDIQKCPKCSSFLIEDGICLGCNYNLNVSVLGEPLGDRSFFTIRESYWESLSSFERENIRFFKEDSKYRHYINKVKLRYNDLIDFFYSELSVQHENRELYLYELSQVVIELMKNGVNENDIWNPIHMRDDEGKEYTFSLYEKIKNAIEEYHQQKLMEKHGSILNYKFAGKLRVSTLLAGLMYVTLLLSVSMAYLAYNKFF